MKPPPKPVPIPMLRIIRFAYDFEACAGATELGPTTNDGPNHGTCNEHTIAFFELLDPRVRVIDVSLDGELLVRLRKDEGVWSWDDHAEPR